MRSRPSGWASFPICSGPGSSRTRVARASAKPFYGAEAVEAHIHETLAPRLLGQDPLRIEYLNASMTALPIAQASTGVDTALLRLSTWLSGTCSENIVISLCISSSVGAASIACASTTLALATATCAPVISGRRRTGRRTMPRDRMRIWMPLLTALTRLPKACSRVASRP